ncbi:monocarboxylate transporter 13-like [Daphnia carinata]|uniref:monocarboxylate transporter 13-like n=1 Tax=Daphnia carinata TaxID=120202 RepID=UPI00257FE5C3|nr:monocarboxylate transporter 13-like [Daphnia carinata]
MACAAPISSRDTDSKDVTPTTKDEDESNYEYIVVPPDGGYGWIVTAASLWCLLISDGILFSFGLILSDLKQVFHVPVAQVAWIFSIVNGSSLISGPVASALSNRFGFRTVVITGSLIGSVGLLSSSFAQSIDSLFFTLGVLFGVADGLVFTPIVVGVGFYFDKRRALATGIALCGSGAGTFVFAPVIYLLLETYTISGALLILSGIYLNCAVLGSLLVPLKPQRRRRLQEAVKLLVDEVVTQSVDTPQSFSEAKVIHQNELKAQERLDDRIGKLERQCTSHRVDQKSMKKRLGNVLKLFKFSLFRSQTFVVVCVSSFFQSIGWFVPSVYLTAHATKMGIPKIEASFLLSVIGMSNMIGRIFNGWLADQPWVNVLFMNNVGLSVAGVLIIMCPLFTSYELLVMFAAIFGLASSCTTVIRPILLGKLLGFENVSNGYSFMLMFYGVATLSGIPIAGLLHDIFGDYHVAFYLAGSSILLSAFICYPLGTINRWEKRMNSSS